MNVVYCVVLGAWDYLRTPEVVDPNARYIAFVDQPIPPCAPWEFLPAFTPTGSPSRDSRIPKLLPDLHFEAEYSIYHDANFTLKRSPEYLIERYLRPKNRELAMFLHPCRTTVEQEANVILERPSEFPTVDMTQVISQKWRWHKMGAPVGLWAAGLIIRKHTPDVAAFNRLWWKEFSNGSSRDQLSLPIARHLSGMKIEDIHGDIGSNDLMAFHWHAAWKDKNDNPARAKILEPYLERRAELVKVCK